MYLYITSVHHRQMLVRVSGEFLMSESIKPLCAVCVKITRSSSLSSLSSHPYFGYSFFPSFLFSLSPSLFPSRHSIHACMLLLFLPLFARWRCALWDPLTHKDRLRPSPSLSSPPLPYLHSAQSGVFQYRAIFLKAGISARMKSHRCE